MSGVKDRFTLPGTKKNQEDLSIDPIEICDLFGTDAVRFALARMGAPGKDIAISEDLLDSYRAFATKIWNAARFIFRHVDESDRLPSAGEMKQSNLPLVDRWILSRLHELVQQVRSELDAYDVATVTRQVEAFVILEQALEGERQGAGTR